MYYTRKHVKTVHVCIFSNLKLYMFLASLRGQSGVGDIPEIKMNLLRKSYNIYIVKHYRTIIVVKNLREDVL